MDTIDVIFSRRSIRKYKKQPVKDKDLLKILEAARMAPSPSNSQPWYFIAVQDPEVISKIEKAVQESIEILIQKTDSESTIEGFKDLKKYSSLLKDSPLVISVLTDSFQTQPDPTLKYWMDEGLSEYEAHKQFGFSRIQSIGASIQNILLTAHALGYGSCWMSAPLVAKREIEEILMAESKWELIALVTVGVPDEKPIAPNRREFDKTVSLIRAQHKENFK